MQQRKFEPLHHVFHRPAVIFGCATWDISIAGTGNWVTLLHYARFSSCPNLSNVASIFILQKHVKSQKSLSQLPPRANHKWQIRIQGLRTMPLCWCLPRLCFVAVILPGNDFFWWGTNVRTKKQIAFSAISQEIINHLYVTYVDGWYHQVDTTNLLHVWSNWGWNILHY